MSLVFRSAHSQAVTVPSESGSNAGAGRGDEAARGAAVVAAFMGEIRRGVASEEDDCCADVDTHALASGESACEEKRRPDRESGIPEVVSNLAFTTPLAMVILGSQQQQRAETMFKHQAFSTGQTSTPKHFSLQPGNFYLLSGSWT